MSFRDFLSSLEQQNELTRIKKPVSKQLQVSGILKKMEPRTVLFEKINESAFPVVGNLFCSKSSIARYFGIDVCDIIPALLKAIELRKPYECIQQGACQEVVIKNPDLNDLPLLFHCENDGGNYISSGVVIARHPQYGQNIDFHRCMQISKNELAMRIVPKRNFDTYLRDLKQIDAAICIGNAPNVLLAAATSVEIGIDELEIANALEALQTVKTLTSNLSIPSQCEFVLEGTIHLEKKHREGPFVDLTETQDIVREEPVFTVNTITHRKNAIWQALLPGALEHKLLMGMPREPTIYMKVNQAVKCLDVNVNPGGCSWLHAIVQIEKKHEEDGKKAIEAAFAGHRSCKHVFVVDEDIDIYDPLQVEWAMATRFQGDTDILMLPKESGSSLDPSAETPTNLTTKIGFDLTKPLKPRGKSFEKVQFPEIDLRDFIS